MNGISAYDSSKKVQQLQKVPTGIKGFDELTYGGLPKGRAILVCGGAGCGKTLLGMEFLVRGALCFDEPGVFISFEETPDELITNMMSLGYDLKELSQSEKLLIDYVRVERSEIEETGEYDLSGLFIRLESAISAIGAKRVVLDTVESLFAGLKNKTILRAELRRLFRWLKERGMTAVITSEKGEKGLTRHNLEEYVSDCVIYLDQRIVEQISTRRLRILKYRGSTHGTNEYPFVITERGLALFPITATDLQYEVCEERVSTGIPHLDEMLGGKGVYCGSSVLISGTSGTGKTSFAGKFAAAVCARGQRCLYFSFEEAPAQIERNLRSIGTEFKPCIEKGLLRFHAHRPTEYGLERHLITMYQEIVDFSPLAVIIDPINNLDAVAILPEIKAMLTRLLDYLKVEQITVVCTSLTSATEHGEKSTTWVSSLTDTWLVLRDLEVNNFRKRTLQVVKSRGMKHSNKIQEFALTERGVVIEEESAGKG